MLLALVVRKIVLCWAITNLLVISVHQSLFCCPDLCRVSQLQKCMRFLEPYTYKGPQEMALSRLSKFWEMIRYTIQDRLHAFVHLFLTYSLSLYYLSSTSRGAGIYQRTRQSTWELTFLFKYLTFLFRTIMRIGIFFYLILSVLFNWYFHASIHILSDFIHRCYPFSVGSNRILFVCWTIWKLSY